MQSKSVNQLIQAKGELKLIEGIATNIEYDEYGIASKWDIDDASLVAHWQNKICYQGFSFAISRGFSDITMAMSVGIGDTTGANAPNSNNIKLVDEIFNGRFIVPSGRAGGRLSKDSNNNTIITVNSLWHASQGYVGTITEWGLWGAISGDNISTKDSGKLISRIAQNYTRTPNTDLTLTWVITLIGV